MKSKPKAKKRAMRIRRIQIANECMRNGWNDKWAEITHNGARDGGDVMIYHRSLTGIDSVYLTRRQLKKLITVMEDMRK